MHVFSYVYGTPMHTHMEQYFVPYINFIYMCYPFTGIVTPAINRI